MSIIEFFVELNFFILFKVGINLGYYFGCVDMMLEEKEDWKSILLNFKNLIYMNFFLVNK